MLPSTPPLSTLQQFWHTLNVRGVRSESVYIQDRGMDTWVPFFVMRFFTRLSDAICKAKATLPVLYKRCCHDGYVTAHHVMVPKETPGWSCPAFKAAPRALQQLATTHPPSSLSRQQSGHSCSQRGIQ
jgi:hypothetical protein